MGTSASSVRGFGKVLLAFGLVSTGIIAIIFWVIASTISGGHGSLQPLFIALGFAVLIAGTLMSLFCYFHFASLAELIHNTSASSRLNVSQSTTTVEDRADNIGQQALGTNSIGWICRNCNKENSDTSVFCQNCGTHK